MKFMTVTTPLCLVIMLASSLSSALPIVRRNVYARDDYAPRILTPSKGDAWIVGKNQTVTWDTSSPPERITNKVGSIQLRKGDITLPLILAEEFDILSGSIVVTVPRVIPGDDYRVVLFGNSGNWSPPFSISRQ